MDLHGNSIWNNATPNSEKAVMLTTKENLESVTKALDESGVNYCFFVRDNSVAIAIAKIAVEQSEIENLRKISEIEKLTVQKPRSNYSPKSSVIGNTPYKDIQNRHYQRLETDLALKVANELNKNSIPFSGRIYGKTVTLTVDSSNRRELERIINDVVVVRNSYKKKIENINNVVKAFADLQSEQQAVLKPLVDMCYARGESFSDTLVSELTNVTGLSPKQTQQFTDAFTETYGSLNESEYIFADRRKLSDLFELFTTENFYTKLTENKAYSEEQLGLISQMVDLNWGNDILERVLDESFSPHSMELLLAAMKDNASYDDIIQIVAEAKNRNEAEVRDMLDVGYVPPLSPVDLYLQQGNGNMRNVLKQLIAFDSVSEYSKRLANGEDSISVVKELFVPTSRLMIKDNEAEIGEISISAQEDSVLFSGSERTVSYTWGIIAGFFDVLAKENLTFSQEVIDKALIRGSGIESGKFRIYEQFQKGLSAKENITFLKNEYGIGGCSEIIPYTGIAEDHNGQGILLRLGYQENSPRQQITWKQVEKRIGELIQNDLYLNQSEKEHYPDWLKQQEQRRAELKSERELRDAVYQPSEPTKAAYSPTMQEYFKVKGENPDSIILFQIGAFYEAMGDDAKVVSEALELIVTSRRLSGDEGIEMCGFPENRLETNLNMLLDRGYSVGVSSVDENGNRSFILMVSDRAHEPINSEPVGRIDYLTAEGELDRSIEYTNPTMLEKDIKEESTYDVKMAVYLYRDENGQVMQHDYIERLPHPLQRFEIIDKPISQSEQDVLLSRAQELISEYMDAEFGNDDKPYELPEDLSSVNLAYTTTEDEQHEITADANLIDFRIETKIDEKVVRVEQYDSLDDMVENVLPYLDFNDLVYVSDEELEIAKNKYKIYQLKDDESNRFKRFERLSHQTEPVNISDYQLVYEGSLTEIEGDNKLEQLFVKFNTDRPDDFKGHSLSVSDVIVTEIDGKETAYYCDSVGFPELPDFFKDKYQVIEENRRNSIHQAFEAVRENHKFSGEQNKWIDRFEKEAVKRNGFDLSLFERGAFKNAGGFRGIDNRAFNGQLGDILHELSPVFKEPDVLDEIDTEGIRLELENSGIVNGEVVDADKLNNNPFIRRVTADVEAVEHSQNDSETGIASSSQKAENFRITDNEIGSGTTMQRFRNNLSAIRTLKELEADGRQATPEEQETLSRYVGWGGLAEFFKEGNPHYQELRDLLTEDEYSSARATTLDSFYTSPVIIDSIYTVLQNSGFEGGYILEPSMGIGNFFGRMPQEMQEHSKLYGVEIDGLTGRIAKQLYPLAHIDIKGFEKTKFKDNSFDVAVGNIPFDDFSLQYDKQSLKIHDYFFMQALDKVKDGGIVAFVTSKGTLDKRDSSFRKQLAEKADLIGAIRLPNNAFKSAGTEVTADIVFLQKRQSPPEKTPDWVNIGINSAGLPINEYFVQHPDMILGEIVQGNKMFGRSDDTMCVPFENVNLSELLPEAVSKIKADYNADRQAVIPVVNDEIPIPENTRNYSYFEYNNNIYNAIDGEAFSLKSSWKRSYSAANIERAKAYIQIRETVRELLSIQQDTSPDVEDRIKELQAKLNTQYDSFYKKYGLMHSRFNAQLFRDDSSYPLMLSLEDKIDKDKLLRKSDIFYKRTIRVPQVVESVDTPQEALALSLAEKGRVDIGYMSELTDIPAEDIIKELKGEIFPIPELSDGDNIVYQTSSEYLSGDIYAKLSAAKFAAESNNVFEGNISALEAAVPTPLTAGEIDIECGATWIPKEIYQQFMYETFKTPNDLRADRPARYPWQQKRNIEVEYSPITNKWNITNKSADHSVTTQKTFGTKVKTAYHILESVLNLHTPNITKIVPNPNNPNETMKVMDIEATKLVKQKAEAIKAEFKEWVFKDPERRRTLVEMYNRQFNCIRPREYDGSHLLFHGMNASIELHQHQKNAIAHAIYGGNTLFAHCVGAGKTFEMIATAMESKRLGLCSKSLFAVPNHLTEQVGADFMKLYPNANILVATKKDFTKQNRSKLLAKIATGNYDAVIIGHSQLGMIPISPDRQERIYRDQIDDITEGIRQLKEEQGGSFQVKQMERTKKALQAKLEKLNGLRKDNTVYFEELGIDKLFVDEAHEFKNLMSVTKLQNVSGISGRTSQRATDLFMKCRYLDEKTDGKGVVFATGTPVSNSVTELHTMMRYLQYDFLNEHSLQNFDNFVSVFGKQKTDYELAPTGDKFKARTRIASYANMPELMTMFKQCADVRTSDSLNLPVPDCELHIVNAEPTQLQQDMVAELSARADDVQSGAVDPTEDNMLKITGDGRKVGLDPRLVDPTLEDNPNTKLNQCVDNVFRIWQETADKKLTQIIFCDLGVPKPNQQADNEKETDEQSMAEIDSLEESGVFCVYDDIKNKLAEMGVPKSEVAFIHEAKTELQKSELFEKVRSGKVRVLIGSTAKMGTGTNVQDRLIALHDLDVPWRPSDLEQRRGRMVRQGNINDNVHLYRYVTKGTFDAYSYQLLETKQRFISQVITSKTPARTCTDVDQEALTYSEIKALCTGDERIKEKLTLENRVKELKLFKKEYDNTHYELEDKVAAYPQKREVMCDRISRIEQDFEKCRAIPLGSDGLPVFKIKIKGVEYSDKKEAAEALKKACGIVYSDKGKAFEIGEINGFKISAYYDHFNECIQGKISGEAEYTTPFSTMPSVNITKLERLVVGIEKVLNEARNSLAQADIDIQSANEILAKPFEHAQELKDKNERLTELTEELNAEAANRLQTAEKPQRTHYFGKAMILSNKAKEAPAQVQERSVEQEKNKTSDIAL